LDLKNYPRKEYTINQFTQPCCFELEGESFYFVMDDGHDIKLRITGRSSCEVAIDDERPKTETYRCLKGDDTTYLLLYEVEGAKLRTGMTFVIDLEQRLVTLLKCVVGENPKYPLLVNSCFEFGAIEAPGEELPFKRHAFTDDLIGTCVQWHWKSAFYTQHSYYCTSFYRIALPEESEASRSLGETVRYTPSSDEWARYIKIKENMYLFVLAEIYSEMLAGDNGRFRSNNMAFLQNYDRMYHVGRHFGHSMDNGKVVPGSILFGAFGQPVQFKQEFLDAPNPYVV